MNQNVILYYFSPFHSNLSHTDFIKEYFFILNTSIWTICIRMVFCMFLHILQKMAYCSAILLKYSNLENKAISNLVGRQISKQFLINDKKNKRTKKTVSKGNNSMSITY